MSMRTDPIEVRVLVPNQTPPRVWQVIGNPELYPRFVRGITWCAQIASREKGQGARYAVRLSLDGAPAVEDEVEIVTYRENEQLVWSGGGERGPGHRGSVRLRARDGGTEIGVLVTPPAGGSLLSEASMRRRLREAAELIGDHLTSIPAMPVGPDEPAGGSKLAVVRTLLRAGILALSRPDRMLRQMSAFARWGADVAGGYQVAAASAPQSVAIIDEQGTHTFADIDQRGTRLANGLARHGVGAGTRVALMCRNHAVMVESIIACGRLGADAVLLPAGLSAAQVADVVRRHEPVAMLVDDEFVPVTRHVPADVAWIRTWADDHVAGMSVDELVAEEPADKPPRPVDEPGRIVLLTSGTTGAPKSALRSMPRTLGAVAAVLSRIPFHARERMLVAAPLAHTWGLAATHLGTPLRATLVLQRRFDAMATLQALAEHQCTTLIALPIMLRRILDLPEQVRAEYDLSSLRIVVSSGAPLPGPFVTAFRDAFGDILYNLYGSAEVSWATIADPHDLRAAPSTAGRPVAGTRLGILDDAGNRVPPGVVGRIFVDNEVLFESYTDGRKREIHHRLVDTGDRGYLDAEGRLFVSGRNDEVIVSGGESVFPSSVEEVLVGLPGVRDAAVIGVSDKDLGQRLAAYVILRAGARLDREQVREYLYQRVARHAVPRDVFFVDRLPRTETGKVIKRLLALHQNR